MGRHADVRRRRGIASWPLVAAGVVVLLIGVAVMYVFVLRNDDKAAPPPCTGSVTLPILASAGASPAARALSDAFNATSPAARSTCVSSTVVTAASGDAAGMLADGWKGRTDPAPAVWITDDGSQLAMLDARDPGLTAGRDTEPLATSPVVLAMRPAPAAKMAGTLSWATLASQLGTDGSAAGLSLLAPDPRDNRASSYALSSMFSRGSAAPSAAEVGRAAATVRPLIAGSSGDTTTTGDALAMLAAGAAGADELAVPVTEADLAAYNSSADHPLTAVYPSGPALGDEIYVVGLTSENLDATVQDAATRFHSFARDTAGEQILAAARMRVPGQRTPAAPGIDTSTSVTTIHSTDAGLEREWAAALGLPTDTPAAVPSGTSPGSTGPSSTGPSSTSTSTGGPFPTTGSVPGPSTTTRPSPSSTPPGTTPTTSTPPGSTSTTSTPNSSPTTTSTPNSSTATTSTSSQGGPGVTFLLDSASSWSTVVGGKSRTAWMQQSLTSALGSAGDRRFSIWTTSSTVSAVGYLEVVPLSTVSTDLESAIGALTSGGTRTYYAAIPAALTQLARIASPTSPQRIVLVTDGPDQTPGTPRAEVIAQIRAAVAGSAWISLDVVGVGNKAPDSALVALAAAGNGTYYQAATTPDLPATMIRVMAGT